MRKIILLLCFFISSSAFASKYTTGSLVLQDVLESAKIIAEAKASKFVPKNICGEIITLNKHKYEIRFFSFEDTQGVLPTNMTLKQYITKNKLQTIKSSYNSPLPGIELESFYFLSTGLNDGVYFSFALRKLEP